MRKGDSGRARRLERLGIYAGRKFYAPTMRHRIASLEEIVAEAIKENIDRTRREILAEAKPHNG
jgi:hypothetical protein